MPGFLSPPRTVLFSTVRKPWADVMPCNYEMQHTLRDLVPLKAFLLAGTTVTIVEEKVGAPLGRHRPCPGPVFCQGSVTLLPCWHGLSPSLASAQARPHLLSPRFSPGPRCHLLWTIPCLPRREKGQRTRKGKRRKTRQPKRRKRRRYRWPWAVATGTRHILLGLVTLLASPPRHRRGPRRRKRFLRISARTHLSCGCWAVAWWSWSPCWQGSRLCPLCATLG